MPTPTEIYLAGFLARCRARRPDGRPIVSGPGLYGQLPTPEDGRLRLVVVDDRVHDDLAGALAHARSGTVTVFETATACARLLSARSGWRVEPATAMARPESSSSPELPLPAGLRRRDVRRVVTDDPGGVPLADAVALVQADARTRATHDAAALVEHLVLLPATTRLLAAVDADGQVCATSGYGVAGGHAHVIFVNTAERWRGRGVGTAMTGAALRAARADGARHAHLDSSTSGRGVYERLGFEVVAALLRFSLS